MSNLKRDTVHKLRQAINENLRVQRGGAKPVPFIDVSNVLGDVAARQNHAVFGRRGCGKTLLLHHSASKLPPTIKAVYLNCEDFKKHSFPNVLIEILDALFSELQHQLPGWFGKKKASRTLIQGIREELKRLRSDQDIREEHVREAASSESREALQATGALGSSVLGVSVSDDIEEASRIETERKYKISKDKVRELDMRLPQLKQQIREFFSLSSSVTSVFLQIDDFYHLSRADQPLVMDYVHRLCKDLPLYFKVATLRHASTLYADRQGQPIGAQERHDYQPINIDFTLADVKKTVQQNRAIFRQFGERAGLGAKEMDKLFKGEGFERLVLAGGGVPRDCLSLFLEVLDQVQATGGDGRIGKDDIRILSRANFERRIEELKQDSDGSEQGILLRGIYVLRQFCIEKKFNVIMVPEALLQQDSRVRGLLYRLLDYRILHSTGTALTHKSQKEGTFQAFAIDIGCYANMRKLQGRFNEIDLAAPDAKEKMRSAPILDKKAFDSLWGSTPSNIDAALRSQEKE